MPPLRPLPDLCLITLFKMMPPNDQMVASQMSPRCTVLVRAANRTVKSLVITGRNVEYPCDLKNLKGRINRFSLASSPAMQQLIDISDKPSFPDYPMTTRLSKWHCLHIGLTEQIDTATIEQIVNNFSAVTDLKYIGHKSERLVALLNHPNWQGQLTSLMVDRIESHQGLITSINGLTALQCLAFIWASNNNLPKLTILAQLKVVAFQSFYSLSAFVRSLEQYASDNTDLQVHLLSKENKALLSLRQQLHSRIVRYGTGFLNSRRRVPLICGQFRSLTSLSICRTNVTDVVPLFTSLSQLHQLVHLGLFVDLIRGEELPPRARPLAQLNSLRALELSLIISSHSQLQWLNLPVTMPNLQAIYIEKFDCRRCCVDLYNYVIEDLKFLLPSWQVLNCLQSSLPTLHSGVPMNRLIFRGKGISAEKLLLQLASEAGTKQGENTSLVPIMLLR